GELVRQDGVFGRSAGRTGEEQLALVVIVEGGGLLGEQIHGARGQVEIGGDQAELLKRQFLDADFLRRGLFLQPLLEVGVDLFFVDEVTRYRVPQRKPGDAGELAGDLRDLQAAGLAERFVVGLGRRQWQPQRR